MATSGILLKRSPLLGRNLLGRSSYSSALYPTATASARATVYNNAGNSGNNSRGWTKNNSRLFTTTTTTTATTTKILPQFPYPTLISDPAISAGQGLPLGLYSKNIPPRHNNNGSNLSCTSSSSSHSIRFHHSTITSSTRILHCRRHNTASSFRRYSNMAADKQYPLLCLENPLLGE